MYGKERVFKYLIRSFLSSSCLPIELIDDGHQSPSPATHIFIPRSTENGIRDELKITITGRILSGNTTESSEV